MHRKPFHPPSLTDPTLLHARLDAEERQLRGQLRHFENLLRKFEDHDLPAYQVWLRREFGPLLSALEETINQVRSKQLLLQRIQQILNTSELNPREALFEAVQGATQIEEAEQQARKRAKLEVKRELRRESKKNKKKEARLEASTREPESNSPRKKILSLYRQLARLLHPDSTRAEGATAAHHQRVWLEVQAAYEASDLSRLLSLASWIESSSGSTPESQASRSTRSFSERYDALRALRRSLSQTERKALELRERPEWNFIANHAESARNKLRRELKSELEDELTQAQEALEACDEAIRSIGPARPPRKRAEPQKRRR